MSTQLENLYHSNFGANYTRFTILARSTIETCFFQGILNLQSRMFNSSGEKVITNILQILFVVNSAEKKSFVPPCLRQHAVMQIASSGSTSRHSESMRISQSLRITVKDTFYTTRLSRALSRLTTPHKTPPYPHTPPHPTTYHHTQQHTNTPHCISNVHISAIFLDCVHITRTHTHAPQLCVPTSLAARGDTHIYALGHNAGLPLLNRYLGKPSNERNSVIRVIHRYFAGTVLLASYPATLHRATPHHTSRHLITHHFTHHTLPHTTFAPYLAR